MRLKPIVLSALFAALLFAVHGCGKKPAKADYSKVAVIKATLGEKPVEFGLYQAHKEGDGATTATKVVGQECAHLQPKGDDAYMYFRIDHTFKTNTALNLKVTVEYYDVEPSTLWVEYDSWKGGPYAHSAESVRIGNPTVWKTAVFTLEKARLDHRENGESDFRIRVRRADLYVHAVSVERFEPPQ